MVRNLTPRGHHPRSGLQSYSKNLDVFVLFSYHERAGDKFVTPCLKVRSSLLSTLSHPDPTRLHLVGSAWLRVDRWLDRTFQQGVTNNMNMIIRSIYSFWEIIQVALPCFGNEIGITCSSLAFPMKRITCIFNAYENTILKQSCLDSKVGWVGSIAFVWANSILQVTVGWSHREVFLRLKWQPGSANLLKITQLDEPLCYDCLSQPLTYYTLHRHHLLALYPFHCLSHCC